MSTHPALERFLARVMLRSALTEEERKAVLGLSYRMVQVPPRADVVSPGQRLTSSCLVAKGLIGRFDQMRDGKRQITTLHIPGEMCDLHSLIAPLATWGLTALCASTILFVPHAELGKLALTYPQIALAFWREGTVETSMLAKRLVNIGRQDARARMAHLICEMGMRMEVNGLGTRSAFTLDITQEQLGDTLGLTAVHVNRTLQGLRSEGLIETRGRFIEVCDWDRLSNAAEFTDDYLLLKEPRHTNFCDRSRHEINGRGPAPAIAG